MVDDASLLEILHHLEESLDYLASDTPASEQQLESSGRLRRAIAHALQTAIQAAIDIGETLAATRGLREPRSAADTFRVLAQEGLLDPALSKEMEALVRFRNILVHGYARLQPSEVYRNATEGVRTLRQFAALAAEWVSGEDAEA
jgi:uncharacterized protein YutE (UPF0331/DUF86 family)